MNVTEPTIVEDLKDLAVLALMIVGVIMFAIIGLIFSQWFVAALARMGLYSGPAEWIAHLVGFFLTIAVVLSVFGRCVEGRWWWRT